MGLDSECDLAIAAAVDDEKLCEAIARFRNQLLAEHLDTSAEEIAAEISETGSLVATIEQLQQGARTLADLTGDVPPEVDQWVPETELLDPEKPVEPDELFDYIIKPDQQPLAYRHLLKTVLLIAGVLILAALWHWTPAREWADLESLKTAGEWIHRQPFTPLLVLAAYILAGMVAFPITLLIIATVIVFGPWWGLAYALAGSQMSALIVFGAGRLLGRDAIRRFAGSLLNRISQKLSQTGLMAVITFRIVPVAPFSVINLVAGVSEIRLQDFALGTFIGLLPGTIAIVLLADRVSQTLRGPDLSNITILGITVAVIGGSLVGFRYWLNRKRAQRTAENTQ